MIRAVHEQRKLLFQAPTSRSRLLLFAEVVVWSSHTMPGQEGCEAWPSSRGQEQMETLRDSSNDAMFSQETLCPSAGCSVDGIIFSGATRDAQALRHSPLNHEPPRALHSPLAAAFCGLFLASLLD